MLQNHPQQIHPSPARLGLTNPNSPSLSNPTTAPKLISSQNQNQNQNQQQTTTTTITTSSTLLSLLPPLSRAQSLLLHMASLTTKLFDLSPNRSLWLSSFRGSLPTFLPNQTLISSTSSPSPSSTKEILSLFTSYQTQLFEAVAQLQEILDIQDAYHKIARDVRSKDATILAFAKKIKEAQHVLEILVDDYADYRPSKRPNTDQPGTSDLHLSDILSYAHRISYTTFAPPEFGAGQAPLRGALPPAPQEEQMRASQLYNFADLDVGLPKAAESKEKTMETLIETMPRSEEAPMVDFPAIQGMPFPPPIAVPSGWRPGMPVELPSDLPLMPLPGWKPGDPVPLPLLDALVMPNKGEEQQRPGVQMAGAQLAPKAPEPIQVKYVELDINPDQDDYSSDYSSEVGSSDEEDEE